MNESRWILLLALLTVLLGTLDVVCAETPEPMPSYADARALREDASLSAVAFGPESMGAFGPESMGERRTVPKQIGIACGDRGTILRSEDGGQTWLARESGIDCGLDDVIWIDSQRVVIVGGSYDRITRISRGVVLRSDDAGKRWQRAKDEELPRLRTVSRDHGALIAIGDWSHSMLTLQFESHDGGRTWNGGGGFKSHAIAARPRRSSDLRKWAATTGVPVPIRDACRINGSALCAVGDHGVILISHDNGKSWNARRGQKRHTAILFVANRPVSVAWSLLGSEALESRNRVALLVHQNRDHEGNQASPIELANRVAVMLGGSGADAIASPGTDLTRAAMEWIAVHRPSVLMLDQSLPSEVHDAFFQAATSSGVRRVVSYSFDGSSHTSLHRDALLPRSGVLASDLVLDAMHYLAPHRSTARSISLRYLYDVAPATRRGDTVVGGMPLEEGQSLAAAVHPASRRQLQIVQARLNQSARIAKLIQTSKTPGQFSESLHLALDQTAKGDQFRLAWSILQKTASPDAITRDCEFQEAALDEFADRFPATSAGRWALLRRETIRHSLEWRRLRSTLAESDLKTVASPAAEIVAVSPFQIPASGVRQVSALSPVVVPKPERHDLTRQKGPENADVDLAWEFHPLTLISREAARRRGDEGGLQVAGGQSANLRRLVDANNDSWSGILQSGGPHVIVARRTESPPRLDGMIDDACWQSALPSAGRSQRLRVAYDDDYVYVVVHCRADQLAPDSLGGGALSSIRDQDLSQVDRMRLWIDTDRDLMTAMQLQVSDAGRTHDAIDSNPRWQPTWYVDTHRSDDQVTIEMAILRRDLVELPIRAGESWFVSAKPIRAGNISHQTVVPVASDWMRVVFQP